MVRIQRYGANGLPGPLRLTPRELRPENLYVETLVFEVVFWEELQ